MSALLTEHPWENLIKYYNQMYRIETAHVSRFLWLTLTALGFISVPFAAIASTVDVNAAASFGCSGAQAVGVLIKSSEYICSDEAGIFGFFMCQFQSILGEIFGNMYCAVTNALRVPLGAALTLTIVLAGACFLTGIIPMSQAELLKLALKVALVWAFATNADYGINIAYKFFMTATMETITIIFGVLEPPKDAVAQGKGGGWDANGAIKFIDQKISALFDMTAIGSNKPATEAGKCDKMILGVLGIMALAAPPVALFGLSVVFAVIGAVMQFIIGYLLALIGITLMMILSPIFLSFALFKQTTQYFNKWLVLTISFSVQMIFIFAFLAFFMLLKIPERLENYSDIIVHDSEFAKHMSESTETIFPSCSICKLQDKPVDGKLVCAEPKEPVPFTALFKNGPLMTSVVTSILGLYLIIMALKQMVRIIPEMAAHIATTPLIQVGTAAGRLPGAGFFGGMGGRFAEGYKAGFASGGPLGGIVEGFKGASSIGVTTRRRGPNLNLDELNQTLNR